MEKIIESAGIFSGNSHLELYSKEKVVINTTEESEKRIADLESYKNKSIWVDPEFKKLKIKQTVPATVEAKIYLLKDFATVKDMAESVTKNIDLLCWEEPQIIQFQKDYPQYIAEAGYGTVFLINDDKYHYVRIIEQSDKIVYRRHNINSDTIWDDKIKLFFVIPVVKIL